MPLPIAISQPLADRLKELINKLKQNENNADIVIANFLNANKDLVNYLKITAVVISVGTIMEDILTGGAGTLDDAASFSLAYRIYRFAAKF